MKQMKLMCNYRDFLTREINLAATFLYFRIKLYICMIFCHKLQFPACNINIKKISGTNWKIWIIILFVPSHFPSTPTNDFISKTNIDYCYTIFRVKFEYRIFGFESSHYLVDHVWKIENPLMLWTAIRTSSAFYIWIFEYQVDWRDLVII